LFDDWLFPRIGRTARRVGRLPIRIALDARCDLKNRPMSDKMADISAHSLKSPDTAGEIENAGRIGVAPSALTNARSTLEKPQ
jgi:hypothetical protein